jgi:DNA-binding NtrC family response regulator
MQQMLGRALHSDEIVYHVDGDQLNDDLSNLQLVSRAEYMRIHVPRNSARAWSVTEMLIAARLYQGGMNIGEVAVQLGTPYGTVRRRLKRLGVLRPSGRRRDC